MDLKKTNKQQNKHSYEENADTRTGLKAAKNTNIEIPLESLQNYCSIPLQK